MNIEDTTIPGCKVIAGQLHEDPRGWFSTTYEAKVYREKELPYIWAQDCASFNRKTGTLRGLHTQSEDPQGKLVRVLTGAILDVVVDMRPDSTAYKTHIMVGLLASQGYSLYVPPGCLHGYITIENNTLVHYKCTTPYKAECQTGVRWDDPALRISWPTKTPILSARDRELPLLDEFLKQMGYDKR